jgi:subtilase family serine protease
MQSMTRCCKLLLPLLASSLCFAAQADRIPGPIDSGQMVVLPGHVNPKVQPQYDQGRVEGSLPFGSVTLSIAPSPSQQAALDLLLEQQQDRNSPNYHKWLTPEQYADRFGLRQNDVNKISAWLLSQGFTVLSIARGRNAVIFSGTAAQIESAFKTEIHHYDINGEKHIANSTLLSIPATLSGVVTAVRGLTDFRPKPMYVRASGGRNGPHPRYTTTIESSTAYVLAPGDIATIYDINALYNGSPAIDGTGQKLAIIGQTDIYAADINDFRAGFGLSTFTTATTPTTGDCTVNSSGIIIEPCNTTNFDYILASTDEGVSPFGDVLEADLDLEWSGAVARNAQIIFVNAPINSTQTSGGVNVALAYAIDNTVAPVISMSYGLCEAENESLETELQQANTEGITIMNSSGDTGSFACDASPPANLPYTSGAELGMGVNYPASSQYVTAVGGTAIPLSEFNSSFWNAGNGSDGGSATASLIGTEVFWNDDEAFAQVCGVSPAPEFCVNGGPPAVTGWADITNAQTAQEDIWISQGGGGVSNCITKSGGICQAGFARPSFQSSLSIPSLPSPQSTYRFVPDVSLLASPNFPGYIVCTPMNALTGSGTDTTSSCANGIATAVDTNFSLVGGTSASSPIFAGIVTLLNQSIGSAGQGNINPTLYALAAKPNAVFHHVTSGDNNVYCAVNTPAGQPADVICPTGGVAGFEASNADATTGYNLIAGLGSVDASNLALALGPADFGLSASALNPSPVVAGAQTSTTLTISPISGSKGTVINFSPSSCVGLPAEATCSFSNPSVTFDGTSSPQTNVTIATPPNMAPTAAQNITISPINYPQTSAAVSLSVSATTEKFTLASTNGATFPVVAGGSAQIQIAVSSTSSPSFITGSGAGATTAVPLTYSCSGSPNLATAEISCTLPNNGQPANATAVTVSLATTAPTTQLQRPFDHRRTFYAVLLPGLFGIVFAAGSRKRGLQLLSMIVVLGCFTVGLGSCGGGGNSGGGGISNPGTPAGQYTVTISATTGGAAPLTASSQITLSVSQ